MDTTLHPAMSELARRIAVDVPRSRAFVDEEELTAESVAELRSRIAARLYTLAHTGSVVEPGGLRPRSLRDPAYEKELLRRVPHGTAPASGEYLGTGRDGGVLIRLPEVRVRVPAASIASTDGLVAGRTLGLRFPAVRTALSPGFLLAVGSRGPHTGADTLRLFVHVENPDAAPGVWAEVLARLEGGGHRYHAKVLSSRDAFPRSDALVVYADQGDADDLSEIGTALSGAPGLGEDTSLFARRLAPGVAVAAEPDDDRPAYRGLSFGQHRSRLFAEGLVAAAVAGEPTPDRAIADAFAAGGVEPADPSRNLRTAENDTRRKQ